ANADTRDVHATVSVPTLVIAGDHDQITPSERARELHAAIPDSRLVIIENAGHLACAERPELYNATLREFFDDVEGRCVPDAGDSVMAAASFLSTQGFPQSEEVEMSSRPASPLRPVISSMQRMLLIAAVLVCLAAGPALPDGGAAALAHDG